MADKHLSYLVDRYYEFQRFLIQNQNSLNNMRKNGWIPDETYEICKQETIENTKASMAKILKLISAEVKQYDLHKLWLSKVYGFGNGAKLAGYFIDKIYNRRQMLYQKPETQEEFWGPHPDDLNIDSRDQLIERIGDPLFDTREGLACFPTREALIAYLGMHVVNGEAAKRKRGQQANWNSKGKTMAFLVGDTILKNGPTKKENPKRVKKGESPYYQVYLYFLEREEKKDTANNAAHRKRRAQRHTSKIWLCHFWTISRLLQGLPVEKPYPLKFPEVCPDHVHYIPPLIDPGERFPQEWVETWSQWGEMPIWLKDWYHRKEKEVA